MAFDDIEVWDEHMRDVLKAEAKAAQGLQRGA
jgi:hypothetical protein